MRSAHPETAGIPAAPASVPWEGIIPLHEQQLYQQAGFKQASVKAGKSALLVIDVQYRSMGEQPAPILEAIKEYPTSCGEFGWKAVPHIARLMAAFRRRGLPIVFPHVAPKGKHDGGRFADKMPGIMSISSRGYEFVAQVAPQDGDILLPKHHASAFFGTALLSHLIDLGVDTLFLAGTTTSGCIRASVVDGSSFGFKIVVPHECVFDRSQASHAVNLFDIANKYGDVVDMEQALELVEQDITHLVREAGQGKPA